MLFFSRDNHADKPNKYERALNRVTGAAVECPRENDSAIFQQRSAYTTLNVK